MEALLQDRRLNLLLGTRFDEDLAQETVSHGCSCGGRLHRASYPRKRRDGPDDLGEGYGRRESFCCAEEGRRLRATPPSLRFLGRKVYFGAVVLLATAMRTRAGAAKRSDTLVRQHCAPCRIWPHSATSGGGEVGV